jgi:hypothetical protein
MHGFQERLPSQIHDCVVSRKAVEFELVGSREGVGLGACWGNEFATGGAVACTQAQVCTRCRPREVESIVEDAMGNNKWSRLLVEGGEGE